MMEKFKQLMILILTKLQFLDDDQRISLESLSVWVFLFITAFRALFAGVTLTIGHDIKWTILDINLASTLPILYATLSSSHKRYMKFKNNTLKGTTNESAIQKQS